MAHRLSLPLHRSPLGWPHAPRPRENAPARHLPFAAKFAFRLAGVAALVGGGVALGRGVVGIANARSNPVEAAGASASAADVQPHVNALALPTPTASTNAPAFASRLRSWAIPDALASPPADASGGGTPVAPAAREAAAYTVAAGDTLSQIAERFGVATDALMRANSLSDANVLEPGTGLTIPGQDIQADVLSPSAQAAAPDAPAPTVMPTRVPVVPVQVPAARPATAEAPSAALGANSPDDAVRTFYSYLDQGQFDAAAALWTQRMQGAYPPAENIYSRFARTQALTVRRADVVQLDAASGRATVAVRLSEVVGPPSATREYVGNWYLVRGATGWLLDEPGLHPN